MVDLIVGSFLLGALYGVFYVGFKAGNKYATVKDAFAALKAGIK
jgi:hypothetical protein